jgi:hypothetical protein
MSSPLLLINSANNLPAHQMGNSGAIVAVHREKYKTLPARVRDEGLVDNGPGTMKYV